jgi:hypothetical protein
VFLAREQAEFNLDFLLGGIPPAIPVSISGPLDSLSYSVDMRAFMRNAAGTVRNLPQPDKARDMLRGIGDRILR